MTSSNDFTDSQVTMIDEALSKLDLDAKCALLAGKDAWSLPAMPAIGLESIVMSDGPVGVRGRQWSGDPAVALPSPTAQAASWDVELVRDTGRLLASEARRKGVHVLLAPTINLHRSPLGGRHFESYSEDPLLTGFMAAAFIDGAQSLNVATTAKHFVANDAETERLSVDNIIDERTLRELYLAPFETAVNAGAWGIMSAYNKVNGASMTENAQLQCRVLRDEWGFDGFIVSDWTASRNTVESANGGTDVAMPGPDTVYGPALATAVRNGQVHEATVDDHVRRVLQLAVRVGALTDKKATDVTVVDSATVPDGRRHAREVARRSAVLIKNDGDALPLEDNTSLAVIGLPADEPRVMGGGSAQVFPPHILSPLEELRAACGTDNIRYVPALDARTKLPPVREGFDLRVVAHALDGTQLLDAPLSDGQINWLGEYPDGIDIDNLDTVEIFGEFTPQYGGAHEFSAAGIGRFCLAVGGIDLFTDTLRPESSDIVAGFMDPPERRTIVNLAAGTPVSLRLRCTVAQFRNDDFDMVSFRLGHADPLPDTKSGIASAALAASETAAAVVFVATTEAVESEGFDRASLALPGDQDELVAAVAAANPRTIVVVSAGAPIEMPWADDVSAILLTWFGGQEFGGALADVLTGIAEPGGRLPTTWPRRLEDAPVSTVVPQDGKLHYREQRRIGYRAWQSHAAKPAWWFGHGLGYTSWHYLEAAFSPGDGVNVLGTVEVTVENTGSRHGTEVVQVYIDALDDDDDPQRWLAGFAVVNADSGAQAVARIELPLRAAQTWDSDTHDWRTRIGTHELAIGHSFVDIRLSVPFPLI